MTGSGDAAAAAHDSTAAWRELLDTLGGLDRCFLEGDRAVTDERHIADGYRMLATTLGVAFDTYLFAEPSRHGECADVIGNTGLFRRNEICERGVCAIT